MTDDQRKFPRFEPGAVKAIIDADGMCYSGMVLDASRSGLAIEARGTEMTNFKGAINEVSVRIKGMLPESGELSIGNATVTRIWTHKGGTGASLTFTGEIPKCAEPFLLTGPKQHIRVRNQRELAKSDIDNIHSHIHALKECQLKLFVVALTVGAALGTGYLTVSYHSASLITTKAAGANLSFWKMWIAMLPGFLSIAIACMITQKIGSVTKNEALLNTLKNAAITGGYPREYRGWEDAARKLKYCFDSDLCNSCGKERCGHSSPDGTKLKVLRNSRGPNLFHVVIFTTLLVIGLLSLAATTYELMQYQLENPEALFIGASAGFVIAGIIIILAYQLFQIYKGKLSAMALRQIWQEILSRCPYQV